MSGSGKCSHHGLECHCLRKSFKRSYNAIRIYNTPEPEAQLVTFMTSFTFLNGISVFPH